LRSLTTIVGVMLALTLIIVSWGMIDSVRFVVHREFDEINREDARVFFSHTVGDEDVAALQAVGVERAEPMADLQARFAPLPTHTGQNCLRSLAARSFTASIAMVAPG